MLSAERLLAGERSLEVEASLPFDLDLSGIRDSSTAFDLRSAQIELCSE